MEASLQGRLLLQVCIFFWNIYVQVSTKYLYMYFYESEIFFQISWDFSSVSKHDPTAHWLWENIDGSHYKNVVCHIHACIRKMGSTEKFSLKFHGISNSQQQFGEANIKENIKAAHKWPFVRWIHWWPVNPLQKGPRAWQCFYVVTWPWVTWNFTMNQITTISYFPFSWNEF